MLQISLRIGERPSGKFQIFGRRSYAAEGFFQPSRGEQSEETKPRRADNKCVRLEFGEKDAFPCIHLESFLCYIHVELSFENVEEFVLTRVHMRRRFISGY